MLQPLATSDDVADGWRSLTADETDRVDLWCTVASAKLRHACPFDIDARIALFVAGSTSVIALDPVIVTDVVVTIVKRYMVNINGAATSSESNGLVALTSTYINRYDKTGTDVRGAIQVTDSDIDQLRPAVPGVVASSTKMASSEPRLRPLYGPYGLSRGAWRGYW